MNATLTTIAGNSSHEEDGSLVYLTLDAISIQENFNPRKFFEDNSFNELVEAIKMEGVIQPIIVRPANETGKYNLIAGERRFRASVLSGCEDIPSVVRLVDDKQATLIALMENATRADLSFTEEADSARIVLTHCDNDKDEAARKLGWTRQKLDQRLALLHAHESVKLALTEQKIKLGHAVLLCQLTDAMQVTTLEAILKDNISVADLKARLAGFTLELKNAPFDTVACQMCPRNSSIQTNLFEDALSGGQCADHECYGTKTQHALESKQADLKETYHVVYLDTERDPQTYNEVCKTGSFGVGESQYEQGCKGCANFGALLSSKTGCVGDITSDLCFDLSCHKTKVDDYKKSSATEITHSGETAYSNDSEASKKVATPTTTKTDKPKKSVSAATPKRVTEKMDAFYQDVAEKAALNDINISLSIAVYTMLVKVNQKSDFLVDGIKDKWKSSLSRTAALKLLYGCTVDELKLMLIKSASHLPNLESESYPQPDGLVAIAKTILTLTQTDLTSHFTLDKTFLEVHTKGGIEIILKEAVNAKKESFVTTFEAKHGEKSFKSLLKEKHVDLIKKVFELGFDFTGYLPSCLSKNLLDTRTK